MRPGAGANPCRRPAGLAQLALQRFNPIALEKTRQKQGVPVSPIFGPGQSHDIYKLLIAVKERERERELKLKLKGKKKPLTVNNLRSRSCSETQRYYYYCYTPCSGNAFLNIDFILFHFLLLVCFTSFFFTFYY